MTKIGGKDVIKMRVSNGTAVSDTYMELINEFPLRRIRTAAEHAKAKRIVLRLSGRKLARGEADYLDVLIDLIADYEKQTGQLFDAGDLTTAELVLHRLEQRGMSVNALAREIGMPQSNLSEMISGRRDWSKAAIRELSKRLNIRAERFLG
jgi:antitoxin component HigA of HigAB toxin-antitoxin module